MDALETIDQTLEGNENYEELKQTTKGILHVFTSDKFIYGLILLVIMVILVKMIDLFFKPFVKRGKIMVTFTKVLLKIFVVFTIGMRIVALVPALQDFTSQIIMSSSLIVVVLGFVFQEGLSNIVHGFILSMFKPFDLGDRITATIDGDKITGYVKEITARHTVLCNVINSTHVIVPNSKMDMCSIANNNYDMHESSSAFMDVLVTYDSNVDKARKIMGMIIEENPQVAEERKRQKIETPVDVTISGLDKYGVGLRAIVITRTVEQGFGACSDIRQEILRRFSREPDIHFAYITQALPEES